MGGDSEVGRCANAQTGDGKVLVCESVGQLGALLLALDRRLPGPIRERSLVAYYRQKGGAQVPACFEWAGFKLSCFWIVGLWSVQGARL